MVSIRVAVVFVSASLLAGCGTSQWVPDSQIASKLSLEDAKELIQREYRWKWSDGLGTQASMTFTSEKILRLSYHADGRSWKTKLCPYAAFTPTVDEEEAGTYQGRSYYNVRVKESDLKCGELTIAVQTFERAKLVAEAVLRWKESTPEERRAWFSQYQDQTAVRLHRTTRSSQAVLDDIKRYSNSAETAVREMRFSEAVNHYLDGLTIAPAWPQGHFNAALILGELYYYSDDAITHMRRYLALVPNAHDARAVQNKIRVWASAQSSIQ